MDYQEKNSKINDSWCKEGWEWGTPITHEEYEQTKMGNWDVYLTPTKVVPHSWFLPFKGCKILGLASGGGQQMPIFAALGADVTILDYSDCQLESERLVSERESYKIRIIKADMTKKLPFNDSEFDLIFNPVSLVYVEKLYPIFKECCRILKNGGSFLCGLDNSVNFISSDEEKIDLFFPFNPLINKEQYDLLQKEDCGYQFSHTLEETI